MNSCAHSKSSGITCQSLGPSLRADLLKLTQPNITRKHPHVITDLLKVDLSQLSGSVDNGFQAAPDGFSIIPSIDDSLRRECRSCQISLRIKVQKYDSLPLLRQRDSDVVYQSRFSNSAFMVKEGDDLHLATHRLSIARSRPDLTCRQGQPSRQQLPSPVESSCTQRPRGNRFGEIAVICRCSDLMAEGFKACECKKPSAGTAPGPPRVPCVTRNSEGPPPHAVEAELCRSARRCRPESVQQPGLAAHQWTRRGHSTDAGA
ncbi:hypothetical protein C1703_16395 [Streptomyces sp. Go-475]|nr:hypothetical protein C1703_16395 [Streptomyces sp. Go-475]